MSTLPYMTIPNNVTVAGAFRAGSMVIPPGSVGDDELKAAGLSADVLQHQHQLTTWLSDHATNAAAKRVVAHQVYGAAAEVVAFGVGCTVAPTLTGTCTVELRKNGTTILTAPVVLDNTNAAFVIEEAAGFASTALVAGDVLEVEVAGTSGSTLPKGVHTRLVVREDANP
jgi:hypothetical protein